MRKSWVLPCPQRDTWAQEDIAESHWHLENSGAEARMPYNGTQGTTSSSFLKPSSENQVNAVTSPHLQDPDSDWMSDRQYIEVFTTRSTMRRTFALWTQPHFLVKKQKNKKAQCKIRMWKVLVFWFNIIQMLWHVLLPNFCGRQPPAHWQSPTLNTQSSPFLPKAFSP